MSTGVFRRRWQPYRRTLPKVRRLGWYYAATALSAGEPAAVCTAAAVTLYLDGTNGSTAASGGTPALTYQWHRSTTSNFTPSGTGGSGTSIAGATASTLSVAAPDTTLYFYRCVVTDSAGSPQTATTGEAPGRLLDGALKVLFIGDSLYYNTPTAGEPSPTTFDTYADLMRGLYSVTIENRSAPGSSTAYWLPDGDPAQLAWPDGGPPDTDTVPLLEWVFANVTVPTHVFIRLGTNDAVTALAAATYGTRMQAIVDAVAAQYPAATILVKYPPYGRPGGSYGGAVNARVQTYHAQIDALTGVTVVGQETWDASAILSGYRQDDIHFSAYGARLDAMSDLHDLEEVLHPDAGGGGSGPVPMIGSPLIRSLQ